MPNLKPYAGPRKLVVAFDIGTTYTGISYAILEPDEVPEILGVIKFPAQELVHGDAKIPSLLYYDKAGNVRAAGAEVLSASVIEEALTEGWVKAEWWKLHLRPKHLASSISPDTLSPLPPRKFASDILADFIKYLFHCTKIYIQENHQAFVWSTVEDSIEYIFTHPNGWEGEQQQLYRQAIERAGLVPGTHEGQSRVHMLTEGEASLHYCVPNVLSAEAANDTTPRGVVIIDAGGGTIDLSMFSMTTKPICCEEIAPAECRLQGSVFVTRRAEELLKRKLRGWKKSSKDISEFTREFDSSTKLVIKSDQEPAYVRVANRRYTDAKFNIFQGKLKLSGAEATGLFNDSYDAIINAFEQQLKYATAPITTAFFVGGLSTNDWLWSRLQSYFGARNIQMGRPDNHMNKAVAHGAVLSLIDRDNHLVNSRVARVTYGVFCSLSLDKKDKEHIQRKKKWGVDAAGDRYISGYFQAKIRKGTRIPEKAELRETFSRTESLPKDFGMQMIPLACYRGSLSDPKWVDQDQSSFATYCTVRADLSVAAKDLVPSKTISGQICYVLNYDVIVFLGLPELQAELGWKTKEGERRVPAEVLFGPVAI